MEFFKVAVWPLVALLLGGFTIVVFRSSIKGLFDRAKTVKLPGGLSADLAATQQISAETKGQLGPPERLQAPAPPGAAPAQHDVYSIVDSNFRQGLQNDFPGDTQMQLDWAIRRHSAALVERVHETNFRLIFASQIRALLGLNERTSAKLSEGKSLYEAGIQGIEAAHIPTYEQWAAFLFQAGYIRTDDPQGTADPTITITPLGRDFLVWMVARGINTATKVL